MHGFGRREFQLMLLHRMADLQPGLVEAAIGVMGASRAELRAAHHRWLRLLHTPRFDAGVAGFRAALGPPDTDRRHDTGFAPIRELRWRLPYLWPDLRWCVLGDDAGHLLHAELVREPARPWPAHAVPSTSPHTPPEPEPWSLVVADVAPYVEHSRDDPMTSRTVLWLPAKRMQLTFVWGLLQTATRVAAVSPTAVSPTGGR